MKHTILASVLAALLAGAVAAAVAVTLLVPSQSNTAAAAAPGSFDAGDLRGEIAALRNESRQLAQRVEELETRPVAPTLTRQEVSAPPLLDDDELRGELQQMVAALTDPNAPLDTTFQAKVDAAVRSIREREELEREQRQQEAAEERLEEQLQKLTQALGLDSYQVTGMREIALSATDKRADLVRQMRETEDFMGMRDGFRSMRDEMEQSVRNLLTPGQYEDYEKSGELRLSSGGRGGGFSGFGGFGGDGGGGGRRRER